MPQFPYLPPPQEYIMRDQWAQRMGQDIKWSREIEFTLSLLSCTIGLSGVFRFPLLCFMSCGAVFPIIYVLALLLVGFPLLYMEIALGQLTGKDCLCCWDVSPLFRGIGYSCIFISFISVVCFNILVSLFLQYLYYSFSKVLPWKVENLSATQGAEQFFLRIAAGLNSPYSKGTPNPGLTGTSFVVWVLIFLSLAKSAKTLGKISYVTITCSYVILTVLLIRGLTLKGAKRGVMMYLQPDVSRLRDFREWIDAALQMIVSYSTCSGTIITLASYNKFKHDFLADTLSVGALAFLTSVVAGVVVSSATGHLACISGSKIPAVIKTDEMLPFINFPASLSDLPNVWSILFYLMLFCLGFGTMAAMTEGYVAPIMNHFGLSFGGKVNILIRGIICFVSFICGIPLTYNGKFVYLDMCANACYGGLVWVFIAEIAWLIYLYDYKRLIHDVEMMTGRTNGRVWIALFVFVTPAMAAVIFISNYVYYTPNFAASQSFFKTTYWCINMLCVLPIPLYAGGHAIYCLVSQKPLTLLNPYADTTSRHTIQIL